MEWNGMKWNEMEYGMKWNEMEWNMECYYIVVK